MATSGDSQRHWVGLCIVTSGVVMAACAVMGGVVKAACVDAPRVQHRSRGSRGALGRRWVRSPQRSGLLSQR